MKVLVTIPHFHNPSGGGLYGSTSPQSANRAQSLSTTIAGLHAAVGERQAFLYCLHEHVPGRGNGRLVKTNKSNTHALDIFVCTLGEKHLVEQLGLPKGMFHHQPVHCDPMLIGFVCRQILKANLGKYDYYCYMEDDLLIADQLFLRKVVWFNAVFGDDVVLFPHRFEISEKQPLHKLYIDGPVREDFTAKWQDIHHLRHLTAEVLGEEVTFERWPNPHSGCFFLNAFQMAKWAATSAFGDVDTSFAGPLESAASLGIMKNFPIYKPAFASAGFFEIQHLHNRYLGEALKFS